MGKWQQGRFTPQNPQKYMGDATNIIYRSSWELSFFRWCDRRESVLKWASEEFSIKYVSPMDKKIHRYYPDGYIVYLDKEGKQKRCIVEIKPARQCKMPEKGKKSDKTFASEMKTYLINEAKWDACIEFCRDNTLEFKILTEEHLGIKPYEPRRSNSRRVQKARPKSTRRKSR